MSVERWRPVVEAPAYEVSDKGRVRSNFTSGSPRLLKPRIRNRDGYAQVEVRTVLGRRATRSIHRLVAIAFLGQPLPGQVTRHLNGNPSDNRLANLAFGTQSKNILDAVAHGTHPWARRTTCPEGHEYDVREAGSNKRRCSTCRTAQAARRRLDRQSAA